MADDSMGRDLEAPATAFEVGTSSAVMEEYFPSFAASSAVDSAATSMAVGSLRAVDYTAHADATIDMASLARHLPPVELIAQPKPMHLNLNPAAAHERVPAYALPDLRPSPPSTPILATARFTAPSGSDVRPFGSLNPHGPSGGGDSRQRVGSGGSANSDLDFADLADEDYDQSIGHGGGPVRASVSTPVGAAIGESQREPFESVMLSTPTTSGHIMPAIPCLQLLDSDEKLLPDREEFIARLGGDDQRRVKIVAVFGNTGDGKSHTLNHVFFGGQPVFSTSAKQEACTVGAWAALQEAETACTGGGSFATLVVDTEGMLAATENEAIRARLLLKMLAICDVCLFTTKAERLHSDMFLFLERASKAYVDYFADELAETAKRMRTTIANLGA